MLSINLCLCLCLCLYLCWVLRCNDDAAKWLFVEVQLYYFEMTGVTVLDGSGTEIVIDSQLKDANLWELGHEFL